MKQRMSIAGMVWSIVAAVVLVSLIVFVVVLGPSRALRIAAAAALNTTIDGFAEGATTHRIPVLAIHVPSASLDSMQADLPWSGGTVDAAIEENGVRHKVKFSYRGMRTPSHFLGGKGSFQLALEGGSAWAPYQKLEVVNPKVFNMVNDHMAAWVAGNMGVPVPMNEMVFVRINGEDHGVMELREQVDGDFERVRHLGVSDVPVYKGDYPPITTRALPAGRALWKNAAHWEYVSDADSTIAHAKLEALIAALTKDTMPLEAHRDSIAELIDVDAFLRYHAALLVINSVHIDQYHDQRLVLNPRTGKFYPVLCDVLMMFAPPDEPLYYVHDAMAWWVLHVPEWRLQRDRYAFEAMIRLRGEREFEHRLNEVIERIRPSVLADRNKYGNVTPMLEDVHHVSLAHVISSLAGFRTATGAYWDRTTARLRAHEVQVEKGVDLRLRTQVEAPLRLRWTGDERLVTMNGDTVPVGEDSGWRTVIVYRTLKPETGGTNHPLADGQRLLVEPLDVTISFANGIPATLVITNAITDETVE